MGDSENEKKRPVLLVAPNGLALRNFLLNERVWNHLTENYEVDVVTPVEVQSPSELGIRKVINTIPTGFLARRAHWFSTRMLQRLHTMERVSFCLRGPEPELLLLIMRRDALTGDPSKTLRWGVLRNSRLQKPFRWLAETFNRMSAGAILAREDYQMVILGHSFTLDVIGFGLEANRINIPLICNTQGHDNLLQPILFRPDVLFVWGDSDVQLFESNHRSHDQRFTDTRCVAIGSLSDDLFRASRINKAWNPAGPVLVPAMNLIAEPDQIEVCEHLIDILDGENLPNQLMVRLRPNVMLDEWKSFAGRHSKRVTLQIPRTAAYDKSDAGLVFETKSASKEVDEYKSVLQSASVVVTMGMTTVGLEAMSLEIPTFGVALDRSDGVMNENSSAMWHRGRISRNAKWSKYHMSYTLHDLRSTIHDVLVLNETSQYKGEEFVEYQLAATDGLAGDRWVNELESYLG